MIPSGEVHFIDISGVEDRVIISNSTCYQEEVVVRDNNWRKLSYVIIISSNNRITALPTIAQSLQLHLCSVVEYTRTGETGLPSHDPAVLHVVL